MQAASAQYVQDVTALAATPDNAALTQKAETSATQLRRGVQELTYAVRGKPMPEAGNHQDLRSAVEQMQLSKAAESAQHQSVSDARSLSTRALSTDEVRFLKAAPATEEQAQRATVGAGMT